MGSNKLKEIVATWADCSLLLLNANLTYAFLSLHLCVFVSTNIRRWWRLPSANLLHLHPAAVRCAFIIWMAKVCTRKPPCLFPLALNERFFFEREVSSRSVVMATKLLCVKFWRFIFFIARNPIITPSYTIWWYLWWRILLAPSVTSGECSAAHRGDRNIPTYSEHKWWVCMCFQAMGLYSINACFRCAHAINRV